jgi:hypothetical protein
MSLSMATVMALRMIVAIVTLTAVIIGLQARIRMMPLTEGLWVHIGRHDNISHGKQKGQECDRKPTHMRSLLKNELLSKTRGAQNLGFGIESVKSSVYWL